MGTPSSAVKGNGDTIQCPHPKESLAEASFNPRDQLDRPRDQLDQPSSGHWDSDQPASSATMLRAGGAALGQPAAGGAAPEGLAPGVPAAPVPAALAAVAATAPLPADVPRDVPSSWVPPYEGAAAAGPGGGDDLPEGGYFQQRGPWPV